MRRQVTHEPVCIFKRWLWLLVENKLYGAKGKAVGRLLIRAVCLMGLVDGLQGERREGIHDDCTEVGILVVKYGTFPSCPSSQV